MNVANTSAEFTRRGRSDAARELQRLFKQFVARGCPSLGPAEITLIRAGQQLAEWERLSTRPVFSDPLAAVRT